jgi:hypothetical protein
MRKIIINKTAGELDIKDTGVSLAPYASYTIVPQDFWLWAASKNAVEFIVDGKIVVNDGEDDLPIRYGIGVLQDNQAVINEYYTLFQDDDVLIGNGEILYYNDEMWSTDEVPFYNQQQTPEDDIL